MPQGKTRTARSRTTAAIAAAFAVTSAPLMAADILAPEPVAASAPPSWQIGGQFNNAIASSAEGSLGAVGSDGRVYLVGGGFQGPAVPQTACTRGINYFAVAAYAPGTIRWSWAAPLQTPRNRLAVVAGGDGRLYAIGGQEPLTLCNGSVNALATVEAYSPATDTWTAVAPMLVARQSAGATEGLDGRIYVFGGRGNAGAILSDAEVYDPATNTWTEIAPMPDPRASTAVAIDRQGRMYVFGGDNGTGGSATVERYTPSTNTWDMGVAPDPAGGTLAGTGVRGLDGRIYLIGMGFESAIAPWYGTNIMIYDPATNSWSDTPQLAFVGTSPTPPSWMAGVASDGTIYAVGPASNGGTWQETAQYLPPIIQTTTTTVFTAPAAPTYGQPLSATSTVSGSDGGGTVAFVDGVTPLAGCSAVPLSSASASYQAQCAIPSLAAGAHSISAHYTGDSASSASDSGAASVTVSPAPLSITASSGAVSYGEAPPAIVPAYSGFVLGDTSASLATQPTCATAATASSPAGNYSSSCIGAVDPNYAISYQGGTVTVGPAPLTIAASSAAVTYGGNPPAVAPSFTGFVNGDSAASLTTQPSCSTVASSTSPVGTYPSSCSGAADPNYAITYQDGTVAVGPAPLVVTASSGTMTYGATVPAINPSFSGFVNGDTAASLTTQPTCTTTASPYSPPGIYPSSCTGAVSTDYSLTYVPGSVSVLPATLTVTANDESMKFHSTVPPLTSTITGFVNGQTQGTSDVTGTPACTTTATSSSLPGSYPITCNGGSLSSTDYDFAFVPGTLTVTRGSSRGCDADPDRGDHGHHRGLLGELERLIHGCGFDDHFRLDGDHGDHLAHRHLEE